MVGYGASGNRNFRGSSYAENQDYRTNQMTDFIKEYILLYQTDNLFRYKIAILNSILKYSAAK